MNDIVERIINDEELSNDNKAILIERVSWFSADVVANKEYIIINARAVDKDIQNSYRRIVNN